MQQSRSVRSSGSGAATTVMSTSNTIVSSQALLSLCAVAVYAVALLYRDVWSVYPATRTPDSMPGFDGDYAKRFRGSAAGVLIGAGLVTASSSGVVTGTALYAMQGAGYAVYLVGAVMAMIAVADSQVADCAAGTARAPCAVGLGNSSHWHGWRVNPGTESRRGGDSIGDDCAAGCAAGGVYTVTAVDEHCRVDAQLAPEGRTGSSAIPDTLFAERWASCV